MEANRYYSVSYDEHSYPAVKRLQRHCGGIVAYGRWEVLKQLLLDAGGVLNADDTSEFAFIAEELQTDEAGLAAFCSQAAKLGLLSEEALLRGLIISQEIADLLAYKKQQAEHGKRGGRPRKKPPKNEGKPTEKG